MIENQFCSQTVMNKLQISAYLAIIYGIGLAGFETLVNWGQWQWWPFG